MVILDYLNICQNQAKQLKKRVVVEFFMHIKLLSFWMHNTSSRMTFSKDISWNTVIAWKVIVLNASQHFIEFLL